MIATLTAIMYVVSITDEMFSNKSAQKSSAISIINSEDGYQLYKFTAYTSENSLIEGDNASSEVTQPLQKNGVYQISGKFTPHKDNSFNIVITTSIRLHLDEDYILISKPINRPT